MRMLIVMSLRITIVGEKVLCAYHCKYAYMCTVHCAARVDTIQLSVIEREGFPKHSCLPECVREPDFNLDVGKCNCVQSDDSSITAANIARAQDVFSGEHLGRFFPGDRLTLQVEP